MVIRKSNVFGHQNKTKEPNLKFGGFEKESENTTELPIFLAS